MSRALRSTRARRPWALFFVLLSSAMLAVVSPFAWAQQAPVPPRRLVFIVNAHNGSPLSLERIRDIYRGAEQYWPSGARVVTVATEASSSEHPFMTRALLGISVDEFRRMWDTLRYQGDAPVAPYVVPNGAEAVRFVGRVPGAIGYAWESDVTPGVRNVAVVR